MGRRRDSDRRLPGRGQSPAVVRQGSAPSTEQATCLSWRTSLLVAFAFSALGWILYAGVLDGPFVFDDFNIRNTPVLHVTHLTQLADLMAARGVPRKLGMATFAANYSVGGLEPQGYHLVNLAVHVLAGWVLFLLVSRLLSRLPAEHAWARDRVPIAAGGALLWFVHPVQTQAVSYVWQRFTSLSALFFLTSLLCYVEARSRRAGVRTAFFVVSAGCGLLALGVKENAAILPLMIVLVEVTFLRERPLRVERRVLLGSAAAGIAFAVIAALFLGPRFIPLMQADFARRGFTLAERLLTESRVMIHYVTLLAYPHPSRLHLDYDFPLSRTLFDPPITAAAVVLVLGLVGAALFGLRRSPLLGFAMLWFFGNLAIESTVVPLDLVYEHRLYVPSMMPLVMLTGWLLTRVARTPSRRAGLSLILLVLGAWTVERNRDWSDPVRLFSRDAEAFPRKARIQAGLGRVLLDRGELPEAKVRFAKALEIDPGLIGAYNNLALIHLEQGAPEAALSVLREALRHAPEDLATQANLGVAFTRLRDFGAAVRHFETALRIDPGHAKSYYDLGAALLNAGDPARATTILEEGVARFREEGSLAQLLGEAQRRSGARQSRPAP